MNDESDMRGDRNLLFGVLALQAGTIEERQLLDAMKQWTFDKKESLGEILTKQSVLTQKQLDLINSMVDAHLELHDNAENALKAISSSEQMTMSIRSEIDDHEVHDSLVKFETKAVQSSAEHHAEATAPHRISGS